MNREMLYNDLSGFLAMHFPCKVQKISINAGFTCPNRDGSVGYGGCTYCNNQTFNPAYCHTGKSVTQQLEEGKRFFVRKYPEMKYLAYFQAYTNTYGELGRVEKKIRRGTDGRGCGRTGDRNSSRLYADIITGLFGRSW